MLTPHALWAHEYSFTFKDYKAVVGMTTEGWVFRFALPWVCISSRTTTFLGDFYPFQLCTESTHL